MKEIYGRHSVRDSLDNSTVARRLLSLDILRGFAILGILLMNIQGFSMILASYSNPYAAGELTTLNYWVYVFNRVFSEQKFLSILAILFGASIILLAQRTPDNTSCIIRSHYKRMFWLFVLGLLHGLLLFFGDILIPYAVTGAIVFLLRNVRPLLLFIFGFAAILMGDMIIVAFGENVDAATLDSLKTFWSPTTAQIQQEVSAQLGSWSEQATLRLDHFILMLSSSPINIGKIMGLMLLGMAMMKTRLLDGSRTSRYYLSHAIVALIIGLTTSFYGVLLIELHQHQMIYSMFTGSRFNYWGSLATAWGYICLVQWLLQGRWQALMTTLFANVGRMALSNYILQSLLCGLIFSGWGFGYYAGIDRLELLGVTLVIWLIQISFSNIWLNHFNQGPLEKLWRTLAHTRCNTTSNTQFSTQGL